MGALAAAGALIVVMQAAAAASCNPARSGHGSIRGLVVRPPGLDPRSGSGSNAGAATIPVSGDPIVVRHANGSVVARAVSAPNGTFSVSVPNGQYTLAEGICGVGKHVRVRQRASTRVTLVIPNAC